MGLGINKMTYYIKCIHPTTKSLTLYTTELKHRDDDYFYEVTDCKTNKKQVYQF